MSGLHELLTAIARRCAGFETLEVRGLDRLDFHEVSATGMKRALEAAYRAGLAAARLDRCPSCDAPSHAGESADDGRCSGCVGVNAIKEG